MTKSSTKSFNMYNKLVFAVLLILTSVYLVSSIDDDYDDDDRHDYTERPQEQDEDNDSTIMNNTTSPEVIYADDDNDDGDDYDEFTRLRKWISLLDLFAMLTRQRYFAESDEPVSEEIGPKFRGEQFCRLLKRDIKNAYHRKCTKFSADENAFDELVNGQEEFRNCSIKWLHLQYETIENATETKDFPTAVMTFCQKRHELFECVNDFRALKNRCSYPSQVEWEDQIRDLLKAMTDSVCSNGGNDLVSLVSRDGDGRKCIVTNKDEIMTCRNKAFYSFTKRILSKFIESERFEFKMDKDDCNEYDNVAECFVSSVENCLDPAARNQFTSMFTIFRAQTSCATII